ncbi:hypothetical protein CKM354_000722400 [Cercospora kikuchii]|uniref:Major facilitator superfamily (MFS) profile domain-containing protein n=1 Tax=Cercospora kikuchii TaxID=84275 RepID=A0A9P3CP25_9PEZI|nr:uncharacterized protein CKM354_000722400 [Cercospora kikuchii]GIZ44015.1 hypothetical protein CKM354_000722400 [Cercospora kikuchii]
MTGHDSRLPAGYTWRSSTWFIMACIATALFLDNFLYSYIIPILPVMLEQRLHVDESETQSATSLVLSVHASVAMVTGPFVGHFADQIPSRKLSLLVALGVQLVGTIIIIVSLSVPVLVIGRSIQAIGGNAAWIVGLATLAETVGKENTGKALGAVSSFFTSGTMFGSMTSGFLLHYVGYWATWAVAIAALVVDMIMRAVMIENKKNGGHSSTPGTSPGEIEAAQPNDTGEGGAEQANEQTALLGSDASSDTEYQSFLMPQTPNAGDADDDPKLFNSTNNSRPDFPSSSPSSPPRRPAFTPSAPCTPENLYKFILTNPRALTALAAHATSAIITTSIDTTLPLHAQRTFDWNSAQISLMFLLLQLPSLILATFMGMLKDRIGARHLTSFGFLAQSASLWVLGAATQDSEVGGMVDTVLGKEMREKYAEKITLVALVAMGISRAFTSGSALLEITNVMKSFQPRVTKSATSSSSRPGDDSTGGKATTKKPNNKMSSAFSVTNFTWNLGMLLGPIISGVLVEKVGYYYMNTGIGGISTIVGILSGVFMGGTQQK